MKICNVKRYALVGSKGRIDKSNVKILREKVLLEESYIKEVNARTAQNGKFIEVLEKESAEREKALEDKKNSTADDPKPTKRKTSKANADKANADDIAK